MERYQSSLIINAPIERVFHFHDNTDNLLKITPTYISVSFTTRGPQGLGQDIYLTVRHLGIIPTSWHVRITEYEPPFRMVDEQIKGPFACWKQLRIIESVPGGTKLTDVVEYQLPLGWLGRLANAIVVRRQIESMFSYRQRRTKELLEAAQF